MNIHNPQLQNHWSDSTRSVHAGETSSKPFHAVVDAIVSTSTYTFDSFADIEQFIRNQQTNTPSERLDYGRYGNPTVQAVETRLAALEGAEAAILMGSGMAAMTTTLLAFLRNGDHIILTNDCYRRTRDFATLFLQKFGIDHTQVPVGDIRALEAAIQPNTRMIVTETPTNPYLRVVDVEHLAQLGRKHHIKTLIDSTFATPFNQRPLEFGIDLVVHSATKYLGGHHDLLSGVVSGSRADLEQIREVVSTLGPLADPFSAYLLMRGLKTLALRVRHHNESALCVAQFLEKQPLVEKVFYPGLPDHPDHEIARRQMKGYGGVVSFLFRGNLQETARLIDALVIPKISASLGGAESLVNQPALMSYSHLSAAERAGIGIQDNLVRYALGLEDGVDIIADLEQAFKKVSRHE